MGRPLLVAALLAALLGAAPAAAKTAPAGALTQLRGTDGCVVGSGSHARRCATARALAGPGPFVGSHAIAASPDGRNLYVAASGADAIVAFTRDASKGTLTQADGAAGCIAAAGADGCAPATGLDGANSVAVSPDGRTVYATARDSSAVVVFARDPGSGALTQAGCFAQAADAGCTTASGLGGADTVAVSPDGRSVYVGAFSGNAVAVFARDPGSGALTQTACLAADAGEGCTVTGGLGGVEGVTVSPDGASVYVASALANAVLTFARDPNTGALAPGGCIAAVVSDGCAAGRALGGPNAVEVSPDGTALYTTTVLSNAMAVLMRSPAGALTQATTADACIAALPAAGCSLGRGFDRPEGLAISPDGRTVYIAGFGGSVDVFDTTDRQLSGRAGCLTTRRTLGCTRARALLGASSIAVSGDGRFVYVASFLSGSVTVFRRTTGP